VGRLATYRYYNMDQVVAQALTLYAKISGARRLSTAARRAGAAAAAVSAVPAAAAPRPEARLALRASGAASEAAPGTGAI
jgi:hypothetical protein